LEACSNKRARYFELQYIHTVQNTGHIGVSQLLPDSVSFFLPDGETLRTVAAVDCRIVDRNASAFAIELEECALGHVKTTKINGRPTDLARIYWRPRVISDIVAAGERRSPDRRRHTPKPRHASRPATQPAPSRPG